MANLKTELEAAQKQLEAAKGELARAADLSDLLLGLGLFAALLLVLAAVLIGLTQRNFQNANDEIRKTLATVPLGVPEGSVRALLSVIVVVLGIAALVLQKSLGHQSSEAIVTFITAVITFYFTTRATETAVKGAQEAADDAKTAAGDAKAAAENAQKR